MPTRSRKAISRECIHVTSKSLERIIPGWCNVAICHAVVLLLVLLAVREYEAHAVAATFSSSTERRRRVDRTLPTKCYTFLYTAGVVLWLTTPGGHCASGM